MARSPALARWFAPLPATQRTIPLNLQFSRSLLLFLRYREHDYAVFHAYLVGVDSHTKVGLGEFACLQAYTICMQRTDHGRPGDDSVSQRAAAMRACVVAGDKPVAEVKDGDLLFADADRPALAQRNVLGTGNANPVH